MSKELELLEELIQPRLKELLISNTPFLTNKTIDINYPFKFPNSEKLITLEICYTSKDYLMVGDGNSLNEFMEETLEKNGINIFKLPLYQFKEYKSTIEEIMNDYGILRHKQLYYKKCGNNVKSCTKEMLNLLNCIRDIVEAINNFFNIK